MLAATQLPLFDALGIDELLDLDFSSLVLICNCHIINKFNMKLKKMILRKRFIQAFENCYNPRRVKEEREKRDIDDNKRYKQLVYNREEGRTEGAPHTREDWLT